MTSNPPANLASDYAAFVLAGGHSNRMGQDKALVDLHGKPLIAWVLATLADAGLEPAIAGARSDLSGYGRVISDDGRGPLAGICAALQSTACEYALFLSVDAPLIPSSLVSFLVSDASKTRAGLAMFSLNGFTQPFPVVISRNLLPALQAGLEHGHKSCYTAFHDAATAARTPLRLFAVEELVQAGLVEHPLALPPVYWFLNLNTPADLLRARVLLRSAIA